MRKKTVAYFLILCMIFSLMSVRVCAVDAKEKDFVITDSYIYLSKEYTVKQFLAESNDKDIKIYDEKNHELSVDDKIPSGAVMQKDNASNLHTFILSGDVNHDGKINSTDARCLLRIVAKIDTVEDFVTYFSCLFDEDYIISSHDARDVLRYAAKLKTYPDADFRSSFNGKYAREFWYVVLKKEYVNPQGDYDGSILQSDKVSFAFQDAPELLSMWYLEFSPAAIPLCFDENLSDDEFHETVYHLMQLPFVTGFTCTGRIDI